MIHIDKRLYHYPRHTIYKLHTQQTQPIRSINNPIQNSTKQIHQSSKPTIIRNNKKMQRTTRQSNRKNNSKNNRRIRKHNHRKINNKIRHKQPRIQHQPIPKHTHQLLHKQKKYYNVQIPKMEKYSRNNTEWNLLTKEDFNFIINDSTIAHASLIHHLIKSGMRLTDTLKLTIGDFMEATKEYHDYIDVDEFIDNAPQNMIATYDFYPEKTKKFKIRCITFTDPETNNLILQNLRKIKNETLPKLNQKLGADLKLSKHDALFASKKQQYKGHLSQHSVSDVFYKKNSKLREHHIKLIDEKINKGELSLEDRQKAINSIPKFHAHGCRKFFISTINKNCGNLRLCTLMEGHKSPVYTDSSYVKFDVQDVKEAYLAAIPDLSLENTETKVYTSETRREMENKISELEKELAVKNDKVDLLFEEFEKFKRRVTWDDVRKDY